jgi:glutaryl-CoA dehydrogenase
MLTAMTSAMPEINTSWDLLDWEDLLTADEQARLQLTRDFLERNVRPIAVDYWNRAEFPHHILEPLGQALLEGLWSDDAGSLLKGLTVLEFCRADTSLCSFFVIHAELFTSSIRSLGSDAQRREMLPDLLSMKKVGAFALTEPDHGSDVARGAETTATRDGDAWVLNGKKRWIGNATFADYILVWAKDTADGEVKGFIVEKGTPGLTTTVIPNKTALRTVQNADIELDGVRIPVANHLPGTSSFRDTDEILANSRTWVAWQAVGQQFAALDIARAYAESRIQFGRPLAANQLIQEQLVRMVGNASLSLGLMIQIARLQDAGKLKMEHASLAKATCSLKMRETVALGRSIMGGNGISTDFGMAKVFSDAEAIYSYEGSYEVNALIAGRAITGISAFA